MPVSVELEPTVPIRGWERSTHATNSYGSAQIIPHTDVPSIMGKTKEGQALLGHAGGVSAANTVTKVTTTHTSTRIITTKLAVGDDASIARIIDTNGMSATPTLAALHGDEYDGRGSGGGADDASDRKVSFPQDGQSQRGSTTANPGQLYSGRLLKNGFRLFKNNWHPVDMVITRDGNMEWANTDAKDHAHSLKLKELQAGQVVVGKTCLDIPAYQSPKLARGLNTNHLIAVCKRDPNNGKLKSYWFLAENDDELTRFQTALVQLMGTHLLQQTGSDVRRVWTGQAEPVAAAKTEKTTSSSTATYVRDAEPAGHRKTSMSTATAFHHPHVLSPISDEESPLQENNNMVIKQRPESKIIAEELLQTSTTRQVDTPPRRKHNPHLSAKEAFFAQ